MENPSEMLLMSLDQRLGVRVCGDELVLHFYQKTVEGTFPENRIYSCIWEVGEIEGVDIDTPEPGHSASRPDPVPSTARRICSTSPCSSSHFVTRKDTFITIGYWQI